MSYSNKNLFIATLSVFGLFAACGTSAQRETDPGSKDASVIPEDEDAGFNKDDFFAKDPPPKYCGPDAGAAPAAPGGTPDCPDDKNREGCPCKQDGLKAACWPGYRKNRGLGICQDGATTCLPKGELEHVWGKCEGYVLPTSGVTKGKEACACFSEGQWKIDNLSPCFVSDGTNTLAVSTDPKTSQCNPATTYPPKAPAGDWSADSLKVDCAGHFKLCYTLKAGDAKAPSAADCTITTVCTEADYFESGKEQPLPPLKAWAASDAACSKKFVDKGGYGEMTVKGLSVLCDDISDNGQAYVFNRVQYCPASCTPGSTDAACKNCQAGGTGEF